MEIQRRALLMRLGIILMGFMMVGTARALPASRPAERTPESGIKAAQQGLNLLMNAEVSAAMEVFEKTQTDDPRSPLGSLLEADATWWKIYLTTGNLIDPDVFNVASGSKSPYDKRFGDLVNQTIQKAQLNIRQKRDVARNYLYAGMAYALRARFTGMRGQNLAAARAGKAMRSLLITALEHDPYLRDAYLGLGIYDYFVDTLPAIVKLLRWIIGLPGGSREQGLKMMNYAAKYGELTSGEAQFYLAKDYSRTSEQQYAKSLQFFQDLEREYPRNALWKLMIGSLKIRAGDANDGEALYRQVLQTTRGKKSRIQQAFHNAAQQALARRHPGEKFD